MKYDICSISNSLISNKTRNRNDRGVYMETMSFRFGFDDYIYYNESIFRKNDDFKEIVSTEKSNIKKYDKGDKK